METTHLTKHDIKALRAATWIGLFRTPARSYITVLSRRSVKWMEARLDINALDHIHTCRDDQRMPLLDQVAYCSHTIDPTCGSRGRCWRTITSFLKPGDVLTLDWYRDCETNGVMEKAEFHGDRLTLLVERTVRGKPRRFEFFITISVCLDNSARMIRRGISNNE